jgi:hypothetical protein
VCDGDDVNGFGGNAIDEVIREAVEQNPSKFRI